MIGTQLSPAALTGSTVAEAFPNIKMIITMRLLFFLCQSVPPDLDLRFQQTAALSFERAIRQKSEGARAR